MSGPNDEALLFLGSMAYFGELCQDLSKYTSRTAFSMHNSFRDTTLHFCNLITKMSQHYKIM